jgi:hypothetical protein
MLPRPGLPPADQRRAARHRHRDWRPFVNQDGHPARDAETPLVPDDFDVPLDLDTPEFRLRPLTPAVAELDYDALMSSVDLLNAMFGPQWPHARFTLEENVQDLVEHQEEFERRVAFAYTVLSPDEATCLGCVYINPHLDPGIDARVRMWVRQSAHDQGLDPVLFETVRAWIDERWPFTNVVYPGRNEDGSWEPFVASLS